LFGVDTIAERVREALNRVRGINARAGFASADAGRLPFLDGVFDCTFCVAVLQHVRDVPMALAELARVTRPGGRVLAVEPDNAARYWYSSIPSGMEAFELGRRFFTAMALARGEAPPAAIGPALPGLFSAAGITPLSVDLFPVSGSYVGAPPAAVWKGRAEAIEAAIALAPNDSLRRLGSDYAAVVARYGREATTAGSAFVEIQNAMLFASVGQRPDA
jgi:SAM-dependent methyltransferase